MIKRTLTVIMVIVMSLMLTSCEALMYGLLLGAATAPLYTPTYTPTYTPSYSSSSSSTSSSASTAKIEKTLETESDGFTWYSTKQGSKKGAQTTSGSTIIPLGDYFLLYYSTNKNFPSGGFFKIFCSSGDHEGIFSKTGTNLIPLSREYTSVVFHGATDHVGYFGVKKQ